MKTRTSALALAALGTAGAAYFATRPAPVAQAAPAKTQAAPAITGDTWLNTPDNKPITLDSRKGKVTVVEFWTFGCSNCRANLPAYAAWDKKYSPKGVEIIGIHTPEFDHERDPKNVAEQVKKLGIEYPVVLDNQNQNWQRWSQQYWPTVYVIDKQGQIRAKWEGELDSGGRKGSQKIGQVIETLLAEDAPKMTATKISMNDKTETKITKTDAEWRAQLTSQEYEVLRNHGTERAYSGDLLANHETGTFVCAACKNELFASDTKFESGTGWPSFYQPIDKSAVEEKTDTTYGMKRTEILCARCSGHLGHVFEDGPKPTGLRYCMNSVAMDFEKK